MPSMAKRDEFVVGLGIVIALYRNQGTTSVDDIRLLKW